MALIEIKDLFKNYHLSGGKTLEVLRGINISVAAGEIFGLIGLSGAGKSTLVRCINRLEEASGGQVLVDGRDIGSLSGAELLIARRNMGMIFQHFNLLSSRTVAGNVAFPLEIAGASRARIKTKVAELLELVSLSDKAAAYPSQLSGGQKQRVGIARALANEPKILLCDEATSALDPQSTKAILSLIKDVKQHLGLTVVLITHEMKVISEICDRVGVMSDGVIVEMGSVMELFTKPQHHITREFVGSLISRQDSSKEWGYVPQGDLVRIMFMGQRAGEPVISQLIRQFKVEVNILQGDIGHLQGQPFGVMLIDLIGEEAERKKAMAYLQAQNLPLEVL